MLATAAGIWKKVRMHSMSVVFSPSGRTSGSASLIASSTTHTPQNTSASRTPRLQMSAGQGSSRGTSRSTSGAAKGTVPQGLWHILLSSWMMTERSKSASLMVVVSGVSLTVIFSGLMCVNWFTAR
ncbi:unnamed protein product [Prorocentrum cordatum]|uniref:Uncharacterized protein n=1 Tax=Prorocentrum cordatum TaxID=2364126 RepID=A0ABN9RAB6_9DINO|nr:unnamed protein product [Polarella glacialis]